jgi:acylphosphatase
MGRDSEERVGFSATVRGTVQGVGFRYSTRVTARRLGVNGFVQNLPDGTVRVECEGDPDAVQEMADWLQNGPSSANVTNVDFRWSTAKRGYTRFTVEY